VGYEGLVIVAIIVIVFLWGPQKLPEMARSLGQAKREFEKAAREASTVVNTPPSSNEVMPQDPLIVAAKSLGIQTEGRTKEEIAKEIASRTVTVRV
jgi:sec-independent protein translocase protein TatA